MQICHEEATWLQLGKHQGLLLLEHITPTPELVSDWKWLWLSVSSKDPCVLVLNTWNREISVWSLQIYTADS